MFKTKKAAERKAREYEREDHAAGLTLRKWEAVPNVRRDGTRDKHLPWTVECVRDDPRHKTSPGPRIPGLTG